MFKLKQLVVAMGVILIKSSIRATELKEKIKKLELEIEDLYKLNKDMISTIKTLTEDNKIYVKKYEDSEQALFLLQNRLLNENAKLSVSNTEISTQCNIEQLGPKKSNCNLETEHEKQSRLLILGDNSIVDLYRFLLRLKRLENYKISSVFKHNADLENVTENIMDLTRDFNKADFVIVSGGLHNALNGSKINNAVFDQLAQVGLYTNLIILSIPLWGNRIVLNKFDDQINIKLFEFIKNLEQPHGYININSFLNSCSFTFKNNLKAVGRIKLADKISQHISKHFLA